MNKKNCNCKTCLYKVECSQTNDMSANNLSKNNISNESLSSENSPAIDSPFDPISKLLGLLRKSAGEVDNESGDVVEEYRWVSGEGGDKNKEDGETNTGGTGSNGNTNSKGILYKQTKKRTEAIERYAELLRHDKSLREFAEKIGRNNSSPDDAEFEEEIFYETVFVPEYKVEEFDKANIIGLRESDDIAAMLPSEIALLSDPDLELLFYKKFAEKKLQTFDYTAPKLGYREERKENKRLKVKEEKRGPIILCVDTSGSMQGAPEKVAKALTLALLGIALEEKRKCILITFADRVKTLELSDMKNNSEKFLNFMTRMFNGGTEMEPAIKKSISLLQDEEYKKADVVMVSDFYIPELGDTIVKKMREARENKTRFHSLNIRDQNIFGAIKSMFTSQKMTAFKEFDFNWIHNPYAWGNTIKAA